MSEISDHINQPPPTDKERAERIRNLLCQLSAAVGAAKEAGLKVEFNQLGTLGTSTWVGYADAVKVTRVL